MACISDDEKRLLSRLEDWLYLCNKRSAPCFSDFLDLREQALIRARLKSVRDASWRLYGGHNDAERAVLAVYPDFYDGDDIDYPFCLLPGAAELASLKQSSHFIRQPSGIYALFLTVPIV